ncbi:pyridoxine/pyridoxamine 5'-phosphate oxidase-like [Ylistrum balloti]|uniref:pyridoxine/pyridoxamine 5'-phosphate oxidase-like n=1 Tax=Ylistrum balloti TaxID=509963 RepID=UPI002905E68A|nr:pyridoxine/pyridoxamine 5'-phosphate oxidase-like [Ylistrum balloti]
MSDIAEMRTPYRSTADTFDLDDLVSKDPFKQFQNWFEFARSHPHIEEANAMALATSTKDGYPSVRMVLMKGYDHSGFQFFTNHGSRKSSEMSENPNCAIMFYWEPLKRSVRIEGKVEHISEEDSAKYFHSRPRTSQIGSMSSQQSTVVESRKCLQDRYDELKEEYKDENKIIPKPEFWGGYLVKPSSFEFWQGQTNRLHDRMKFRRQRDGEVIDSKLTHLADDGWVIERLSP